MAVKKITGFADSVSVLEYTAGSAQREITYPGLQQCISITGRHNGVILGTHISPGASSDDIEEHFDLLQTGFGPVYPEWYIAGQFQNHYTTPKAVMGSPEAFRKTVRKHLGKTATFYVFDTSALADSIGNWGINIRAELVGNEPKFSFRKAMGKADYQSFSLWYFSKMA